MIYKSYFNYLKLFIFNNYEVLDNLTNFLNENKLNKVKFFQKSFIIFPLVDIVQ